MLETPALYTTCGGNLTLIISYDTTFLCFTFLPTQHHCIFNSNGKFRLATLFTLNVAMRGLKTNYGLELSGFVSFNLHFRLWNQSTFLLICTNGSTLYLDLNRKVGSIHLSKVQRGSTFLELLLKTLSFLVLSNERVVHLQKRIV